MAKKKTGRKGLYHKWLEEDNLVLLRGWAREGLTDEEIASRMGIHVSTLYTWKNKYSEIDEALKKGKDVIDFEVEEALIKAALGYSYEEETVVKVKDSHGNEQAQIKKVKKHAHPNVAALIFWLKNRKPSKFRDKPVDDSDGDIMRKLDQVLDGIDSAF